MILNGVGLEGQDAQIPVSPHRALIPFLGGSKIASTRIWIIMLSGIGSRDPC